MENPRRLKPGVLSVQDSGSMNQPTLPTMADQCECPACCDQATAIGRRNRTVFYRCQCGLEFEVMTPGFGSFRGSADRLTPRSEASRSTPGPLASMLLRHRDGGQRQ